MRALLYARACHQPSPPSPPPPERLQVAAFARLDYQNSSRSDRPQHQINICPSSVRSPSHARPPARCQLDRRCPSSLTTPGHSICSGRRPNLVNHRLGNAAVADWQRRATATPPTADGRQAGHACASVPFRAAAIVHQPQPHTSNIYIYNMKIRQDRRQEIRQKIDRPTTTHCHMLIQIQLAMCMEDQHLMPVKDLHQSRQNRTTACAKADGMTDDRSSFGRYRHRCAPPPFARSLVARFPLESPRSRRGCPRVRDSIQHILDISIVRFRLPYTFTGRCPNGRTPPVQIFASARSPGPARYKLQQVDRSTSVTNTRARQGTRRMHAAACYA